MLDRRVSVLALSRPESSCTVVSSGLAPILYPSGELPHRLFGDVVDVISLPLWCVGQLPTRGQLMVTQ
jgi:hypothetical protein